MGTLQERLLLGTGTASYRETAPPRIPEPTHPAPVTPAKSALLQALRALAALSIAFQHIIQQAGAFTGRPGEPAYPWLSLLPWDAGVLLFFAISGIVMVWSAWPRFGQPGAVRWFAARRLARIVPLYWVATLLFVAVLSVAPGSINEPRPSLALVVSSFLFIPWPRPDGVVQPLLGLGWTLNYEMLFYAIFAGLIALPRPRALAAVLACVVALAAAGWALHPSPVPLAFWTDQIVLEFALGIVVALIARRLSLPAWLRVALALAGLAGLLGAERWSALPDIVAIGIPCAVIAAAAVLGPNRPARTPILRFLVRLGDASYALYLVHPFPMRGLALVWPRIGLTGMQGVLGYVAAATVASVLLALVVHRWVERPLTARARRLLDPPRRNPDTLPPRC